MENCKDVIYKEILDSFFEKAKKDLEKKVSKKNQRTKEGLEKVFGAAINEFLLENKCLSETEFKKELTDLLEKNYFYYFNEPLIFKIVRKFDNLPLPENERYQAAASAFSLALNTFDPNLGYQFSTYAWTMMYNEIIVANKKRIKHEVIKQKDYKVIANENSTVIKIEEELYGKKIIKKKEIKKLYNVNVMTDNGTEKTYKYIYDLNKKIKINSKIKAGDILGMTSGVETEYASVDLYTENEEHADVMFYNPTTDRSVHYYDPDSNAIRNEVLIHLSDILNSFPIIEQKILIYRYLLEKKFTRKDVAKILNITEYNCSKTEKLILSKLKYLLEKKGIDIELLDHYF
jgi:RNA polymerase sigma factor, sigma-70 family